MTTKSRAASAAEKAARMGAAPAAAPVPEVQAVPVVKSKSVRVSLDLTPALYEDLTTWNREAARRMGRTKVTNADTLRSLVRVLLDQPEVADQVIADLMLSKYLRK